MFMNRFKGVIMIYDALVKYGARRYPISGEGETRQEAISAILRQACLTLDKDAPSIEWARNVGKMQIMQIDKRGECFGFAIS